MHQRELAVCRGGYLNPEPAELERLDPSLSTQDRILLTHLRRWGFHALTTAGLIDIRSKPISVVDNLGELFRNRPEESLCYTKALDIIKGGNIYVDVSNITTALLSAQSAATTYVSFMKRFNPTNLSRVPLR